MSVGSGMDWAGRRTLRDLIDERVNRFGGRTCMVVEHADGTVHRYDYREFRREVRRIAAGLQKAGLEHGDRVVLMLPNRVEFVFGWFAAAWIGAVAVPANTANTAAEMAHVIGFSEASMVITNQRLRPVIEAIDGGLPGVAHRIVIDGDVPDGWQGFDVLRGDESELVEDELSSDDLAQLVFTSGTTSRPKAVMLTHANCLHAGIRGAHSAGVDEDDTLLSSLPAFHVNAQAFTILAALTTGAAFVLLEQYSASRFIGQVRRHRATITSLVAMQVRTLLAQPTDAGDGDHLVRRSIFAMTISREERDAFEQRFGITLLNGYGLSEAMTGVAVVPLHGEHRWPSIGLPAIGLRVKLVDDQDREVPVGEPGEIVVGGVPGRTVMKGYHNDPDATAATIRDGWVHTGDVAYADADGYLYFVDRLKDVIKRAGENVSASEVEAALATHPAVLEAAVIGVPDPIRDEAVKAFVVLEPGRSATAEELIEHCRGALSAFKIPSLVEFRLALPKTSIGKVEKKQLRAESAAQPMH